MRRYVIPVSYLNQPSFLELLSKAEEDFGYDQFLNHLSLQSVVKRFHGDLK